MKKLIKWYYHNILAMNGFTFIFVFIILVLFTLFEFDIPGILRDVFFFLGGNFFGSYMLSYVVRQINK